MADVRMYEAVVLDGAPDPDLPGHIRVRIPELYRDNEVPTLIPPLYPGTTAGGWQSVPSAEGPDGEEIRVIVAHMGGTSFRWMGTSQTYSAVGVDTPNRVGARSKDGRHYMFLDNVLGFMVGVGSNTESTDSYIAIDAEDDIITLNVASSVVHVEKGLIHLQNSHGDSLQINDGNVVLMHKDGIANLNLRSGDVAALSGTVVQLSGGSIEMGDGVLPPLDAYVKTLAQFPDFITFLTALDVFMTACALATVEPALGPAAAAFQAAQPPGVFSGKFAASLAAGAPYLSTRIYGD